MHWLAVAFDRAWDWTWDREANEANRVRLCWAARHIAQCQGATCPCAHEDATPIRRLLIARVRGVRLNPRTSCDVLDADLRWRFWQWAHIQTHNWSIRFRANDPD
jgi:hypothetical protein